MLLTCPSCNSKYLLNSADLKPNGRTVQCVKCDHKWFQEANTSNLEVSEILNNPSFTEESTAENINDQNHKIKNKNNPKVTTSSTNLPSTYVKEKEVSIINSIIALMFLPLLIFFLWLINSEGISVVFLFNFYLQEFYFNLKLIINDFAKIIHEILN